MIKVYFETPNSSYAELVAEFKDEYLYYECLEALERVAKSEGMIITESIE